MIWEDMVVERELSREQIAAAMARLCRVPLDNIWVTGAIDFEPGPEDVPILCEVEPLKGKFKCAVHLILDASLHPEDEVEFVQQLSADWECRILVGDDSPSLVSRILITTAAEPRHVWLDAGRFHDDEWCLASDRG